MTIRDKARVIADAIRYQLSMHGLTLPEPVLRDCVAHAVMALDACEEVEAMCGDEPWSVAQHSAEGAV